jgi:pectinesterase
MKKLFLSFLMMLTLLPLAAANKYDNPDTIVVSRDGTGEFRTIDEAIEVCRAFMDYSKVIYVKKGVYKEKLILPSWLTNITICGEDRDNTIITWDDHANIKMPVGGLDSEAAVKGKPMGTFRTYTLKVQGSYITLKNITIENNAEPPATTRLLNIPLSTGRLASPKRFFKLLKNDLPGSKENPFCISGCDLVVFITNT